MEILDQSWIRLNKVSSTNKSWQHQQNTFLAMITRKLHTLRWENVNSTHIKDSVLIVKSFDVS